MESAAGPCSTCLLPPSGHGKAWRAPATAPAISSRCSDPQERTAIEQAAEVVEEHLRHARLVAGREPGAVRRHDDVGHAPEWRGGGQRLVLEGVEVSAAEAPACQCRHELV